MSDTDKTFAKEYLLTSGCGAYSASTISGCNTRKYHGLLVSEQPQIDDNDHVLVSALDEQVSYKQNIFPLSTRKYPDTIYPAGYKYIEDFYGNPVPKWVYKLGDCIIEKELLMSEGEPAVMIRYSVKDASEKLQLDLAPFLAFRRTHDLKGANLFANKKVVDVANGIKTKLYSEYSGVHIQMSNAAEFIAAPDWHYHIEYPQEQIRGYSYAEDLFVPGHFRVTLKKGDVLVVYVGIDNCQPKTLKNRFTTLLKKKPLLNTEKECLLHAARQFVVKRNEEVRIKAGYHWFGSWGRDTFISLPGLLLVTGNQKEFTEVVKTSLHDLKNGLLPNTGRGKHAVYNSVDTSLWFVWAVQQYADLTDSKPKIWAHYGKHLSHILEHYRKGTLFNIMMDSDGLITAGQDGMALTWMDAIVNGVPVTQRAGKTVEVNALWYNAVCFCLEMARLAGDKAFVAEWEDMPDVMRKSFMQTFWDDEKQYLADCVNGASIDWSIRPNQIIAVSLRYSPLPEGYRKPILDTVKKELLTERGLRTLSRSDKNYKGAYEGNQHSRDMAYHQGTIWPWLWGHFSEAYLKEYGHGRLEEVHEICYDLGAMLEDQCLYTIPEIYNGDEPYKAGGAVAQAWSVAELLRMDYLLEKYTSKELDSLMSVI